MKIISKIVLFVFTLCIVMSCFVSALAQTPELASTSALLIDAQSGNVLFEKNANQQMAPASTTKIMTLLLAAEYGKMDEQIIVDSSVFSFLPIDATIAYFQQDEVTTVEAAFMASYLMSANDGALILAHHIGGSVENFVDMMNERAKELGCTSTNFKNPTGLYDSEHYTTAHDMALIAKAFYNNQVARELISKREYTIPQGPSRPQPYEIVSNNLLMDKESSNYYPSVVFSKNGYTDLSKCTIVALANKDNTTLLAIAFQSEEKMDMYSDIKQLLDHGFGDFYTLTITKTELENLFSGKRKEYIVVENDLKLTIPSEVDRESLVKSVASSNGEAYVSVKGDGFDFSQKIADIQVKNGASGFFAGIWWFIKFILKIILWLVIIVAALYLLLAIYINSVKSKKRKRKVNRSR